MGRQRVGWSSRKRLLISVAGLAGVSLAAFALVSGAPHRGARRPVPMPVGAPAPASAEPAPPRPATSELRPVGSPILSDGDAATHVRRSGFEPRPGNAAQNQRVPATEELARFRQYKGQWGHCDDLRAKVTGAFIGTTDEIIQWAAWKWGLPEDVLRAVAVSESDWDMGFNGDDGASWGLMQIKNVEQWHGGKYPLSKLSTAFNADYHAGIVRHYFEGCATWMADFTHGGHEYRPGDLWGSIGAWYSGDWYSDDAQNYIDGVQQHLAEKPWEQPGF